MGIELIKIGNSRGIRIPNAIIKQSELENTSIDFEVTKKGLLLKPSKKRARFDWEEKINKEMQTKKDIKEDSTEFFELDLDVEDWEW